MGGDGTRALDQTPTWAVAAVCAVIVAASILLEGFLHHLGQLLNKKRKKALFDALEKAKSNLTRFFFEFRVHRADDSGVHIAAADRDGKGMVSLVSADGMHQLHIFVFFLAVFHVTFSFFTMSLGRAKTRIWKVWEKETCSPQYNYLNDPSKFRLTHQTSFVRQHASCWSKSTITLYFVSHFMAPFCGYNNPPLWASALAVMLFNVHGWHNLFWFSAIPLVVILAVGTKLQAIIAMMAIEIAERHTVIQGMPVNAFEITYFFWIWYEFGLRSCFHDNFEFIIARVCLGAIVQFMCSYITLPLYALVSQMGSEMKRTIFDEQTAKALKKWHKAVVKKKHHKDSSHNSSETPSTDTTGPAGEAGEWQRLHEVPVRHLHRYKTIAHVGGVRSPLSDPDYSDTDDTEPLSLQTRHLIPPAKQRSLDTERAEVRVNVVETAAAPSDVLQDSFSFPRLLPPRHVPDK
ncbi:barley mlo defense gene homolog2 [Zea mays]|uniref:MLO-like protein n=1 Tax=Zea mays TaxID=4577 RepID=A0A1D6K7P3_MAIZE|nr:barley mlo defense gene homolog2 [Zea mays]